MKQKVDAAMVRMVVGKPSDYGLPDPDYKMYESHPVINSLVLHHLGHGDIRARSGIDSVNGKTVTFSDGHQQDRSDSDGHRLPSALSVYRQSPLNWRDE